MMSKAVEWVVAKIAESGELELLDRPAVDIIVARVRGKRFDPVVAGVIGIREEITAAHVKSFFASDHHPAFIINIPSATPWRGDAIEAIHSGNAAFGSLGDFTRAASMEFPGSYREREAAFFYRSISQHTNVCDVSMVFDRVFRVERFRGDPLTIAMIDAYNVSAEDVRNARALYGFFNIAVKVNGYGSVTSAAEQAAARFGAQALTYGEMMSRLHH